MTTGASGSNSHYTRNKLLHQNHLQRIDLARKVTDPEDFFRNPQTDANGNVLSPDQKIKALIAMENEYFNLSFDSQGKPLTEEQIIEKQKNVVHIKAPKEKSYKLLGRIEKVFYDVILSVLDVIGIADNFKGYIKERLKEHNLSGFNTIKNTHSESKRALEAHRSFNTIKEQQKNVASNDKANIARKNDPLELMEVSKGLFSEPVKLELHDTEFVHTSTAEIAVEAKGYLSVPQFSVADLGKLIPKTVDKDNNIVNGQVTPTSYILGKSKIDKNVEDDDTYTWNGTGIVPKYVKPEEHLTNIYVLDIGPKQVVIRSGVIDTEVKKNDFVEALKEIYKNHALDYKTITGRDLKLRVVSQQLNSFETEARMIQDQHYWLARANDELQGIAEIVHINTASNRWYHVTKGFDSLGMVGRFIKAIAPMNFLQGERLSKALNLPGMGIYVNWVANDLSQLSDKLNVEGGLNLLDELNENNFLRNNLKNNVDLAVKNIIELRSARKDIKNPAEFKIHLKELDKHKKALKHNRMELEKVLEADYKILIKIEDRLRHLSTSIGTTNIKKGLQTVTLMRQVLGSQLGLKKETLDRGEEGMALQMLNDRLGVVSAMNCKSGLDRTGIWHAIKLAMLIFEKKDPVNGPARAFNLVNGWEETTELINKINARNPFSHTGAVLEASTDKEELKKEFELPEKTTDLELQFLKEKIKDVLEFRKEVLNNLITIGIPITILSTGVGGFKWNTGHEENLIPLNFLPSHVKISREMEVVIDGVIKTEIIEKLIPLVKYNDHGEAIGITEEGAQLLTKHQKLRGS